MPQHYGNNCVIKIMLQQRWCNNVTQTWCTWAHNIIIYTHTPVALHNRHLYIHIYSYIITKLAPLL